MKYTKGEWTNCRYDICEIECDGEIYCTVATKDVDLIINVLNENEQLKQQLRIFEDGLKSEIKETKLAMEDWNECLTDCKKLKEENEQLKQTIQEYYETTNADGKQIISDLADLIGMRLKGDVE